MPEIKTIFIGTSDFAAVILKEIIQSPLFNVLCLISAPDKPVGRKQALTPPPAKQIALKYKLAILQPNNIADCKLQIANFNPHLIITAAYGKIIPQKILDIPKFGSINIHPSLLPKHRGPSPIQTAILKGDKRTGATIMLMDEKMDHGPIIAQKEIEISSKDNSQTLSKKLSLLSAKLLIETTPLYVENKINPYPQDESKATYTEILTRQDGKINWQKNAREIERQIRAFYPWPGSWTIINKKRLKIITAKTAKKNNTKAIKAKKGWLLPIIVQLEGKKPTNWNDFLRGRHLAANIE